MNLTTVPQFLRLTNRPCLILGESHEALFKGRFLLEAGGDIRVVSKHKQQWPEDLASQVTFLSPPFNPDQLQEVWLVVSALEEEKTNQALFEACEQRQIFLNVVDQPKYCSFIWPALVKREPFMIAISSGGRGPALSGWLRRKLEQELPQNLGEMAEWFSTWRKKCSKHLPTLQERGKFWRTLFDNGLLDSYLSGDIKKADLTITEALNRKKS
jgi:siroheme synthase-like protein